jgi:hypothetical protein
VRKKPDTETGSLFHSGLGLSDFKDCMLAA